MLKKIAAQLPERAQQELKRIQHGRQIKNGHFNGDEPEFFRLSEWLTPGDWCLDVGANIGHYARAMSDLVGAQGRVIAFEPMSNTFELLAANAARFQYQNVTLVNAAVSSATGIVSMGLPTFNTGLNNYYRAQIGAGDIQALALSIDSLNLNNRVSLIKIDVEGHELQAIRGMVNLIENFSPILIVEDEDPEVELLLNGYGYKYSRANGSPNRVFTK
ncbi:MAG: methyltransferase FkbM family [Verrucomicrobiaceae bacterium]|nr:methyltransferase FkbM family [Verrucomicrobiaceae bacterium]